MNIFDNIKDFYDNFDGEKGIIGFSALNKPIYYLAVKKSPRPVVIVQYAMHAREHITAHLALYQIRRFNSTGKRGTVYFVPMVNPDGVKIALNKKPLYKANGRGVDLNVNFDARWGEGKLNVKIIGDENFIGERPFSEPESVALRDFTLKVSPDATVSYHCKGEEIYWEFFQKGRRRVRDKNIAEKLSMVTGYAVKSTPNSCGGYKDWCVQALKIPAFTIEVGNDDLIHPLGKECLKDICEKNENVIDCLIGVLDKYGNKIYESRHIRSGKSGKNRRSADRRGNRKRRKNYCART